MRLYAIVWGFNAMVSDTNALLRNSNAMVCYGVFLKRYALTDYNHHKT